MRVSRFWRRLCRNARATRAIARTARNSHRPLLAHIVPIRRCNLACGYCNEHDRQSAPVPLARVEGWLDKLADLRTAFVTCSGGEPLLHPQIVDIVSAIRTRGMIPGLITNGCLLTPAKIRALNEAGLEYLQVSIDNLEPDHVSRKSLRLVDRHLASLAELALFDVNVNSVLGGGTGRHDDVRAIGVRARALGFSMSVGVIHDASGGVAPLSPAERTVWEKFNGRGRRRRILGNFYSALNGFQLNLVEGRPNSWKCRAGARYLYISETGMVGHCSQHRDTPGIPIEQYTPEDVQRELNSIKTCAPYCTIGCVHRVSALDWWLDPFRRPDPGRGLPARDGAPPQPASAP
jgi:MoaA/NifB/PqqE/SkfB family radical SAM enzyme